jgi:hypothetical protein
VLVGGSAIGSCGGGVENVSIFEPITSVLFLASILAINLHLVSARKLTGSVVCASYEFLKQKRIVESLRKMRHLQYSMVIRVQICNMC